MVQGCLAELAPIGNLIQSLSQAHIPGGFRLYSGTTEEDAVLWTGRHHGRMSVKYRKDICCLVGGGGPMFQGTVRKQ
jgi:hypothetical protein